MLKSLSLRLLVSLVSIAVSLSEMSLPVATQQSQLFNGAVDRLPVKERVTLKQGNPVVQGDKGNYTARILINASVPQTWSVLTDYNNYSNFMPDVTDSKVLESNGDRHVFEHIIRYRLALLTMNERIRIAIQETPQKGLSYSLLAGKLKQLQGSWTLEPVSAYPGGPVTQVLLTERIQAQPRPSTPKGLFYNRFRDRLDDNLLAIRKEIVRRNS